MKKAYVDPRKRAKVHVPRLAYIRVPSSSPNNSGRTEAAKAKLEAARVAAVQAVTAPPPAAIGGTPGANLGAARGREEALG